MYKTGKVNGEWQIFWRKPSGQRHLAELTTYTLKANAERRRKQLEDNILGACAICGEPATHWDNNKRIICSECWLALYDPQDAEEPGAEEPLDTHFSVFLRASTVRKFEIWCEQMHSLRNVSADFFLSNQLNLWKDEDFAPLR